MFSLGSVPFSPTSTWNTPIGTGATYTQLNWPAPTGYNYNVAWNAYSPSVYVASDSDPLVQVTYPPGWGYPGGTMSVRMPLAATGAVGTDGELLVVSGDTVYNFWQFNRTSATTATAAALGETNIVTGTGWGTKSPFLGAGTTAVGASQMAGLLVKAETDTGQINHALEMAVDSRLALPGFTGGAISGDGGSATGIVKEGDRLAIAPGTPMPAGLSPLGQEVFRAMQQYGVFVVDVAGGTSNIRAQANAYDGATMTALWHDMSSITPLLQGVSGGSGTPPPSQPASLSSIAASGTGISNGNGNLNAGTVHLTVGFSKPVNVTGTPTLTLNNNATASYVSGSGSNNLVFDYTVAAGQDTPDLAVSAFNLGGVKDLAGNSLSLTGAPTNPAGTLGIDTTPAKLLSLAASGTGISNGDGTVNSGTVHLTLTASEAVNVTGTPTLTLNNNATASYVSGSGSNNLVFDYTVAAGQDTPDLAVSAFNLGGVKDRAGNSLNLTGAPTNPPGTLAIGAPPAPAELSSIAASGTGISNGNGNLNAGTVHLTLGFSKPVNVTGTPTLTLNNNATASYVSGSGSNNLVFDYTVAAGQDTSDLAVSAFNLGGVKDLGGNGLNLTGAPTNPAGTLGIDTTPAKLLSLAASGTGISNGDGTVNSGTVHLTLTASEAVNVTGTPTLTLNNNATASYVSGSGSNNLVFDYTVTAGQDTPDLAVSAFNLGGVKDRAGNSLNLTGAPTNPPGTLAIATPATPGPDPTDPPPSTDPTDPPPSTDPTDPSLAPTVVGVTTNPLSGRSGTISLTMSENVTVNGTPSLLLDNGGTAIYKSGSGSSTLTFAYSNSYWSRRGSTPQVTGAVLPSSSSITDLSGNAADLSDAGTATTSSGGRYAITGTTELELFGPSTKRVSFAPGASGELKLDAASQFDGRISGFGRGDTLDLGDIAFGSNTTLAYQANRFNSGGTLSVSDGEHVAKLALLGQYTASSFVTSAGATGGTAIHDAVSSSTSSTLTASSQAGTSTHRHHHWR
jgi:hypothetical protein